MFDYLYAKQYAIQRQRDGLFAQERERYLQHCHSTGSTRVTLQVKGQALLRFANHMRISDRNGMDRQRFNEIVGLVTESNPSPGAIYGVKKCSQPWLRFLGWLVEPENPKFFIEELESYVSWMRDERGLSSSTIEQWTERLTSFLCWYGGRGKKFSQINIHDIDAYFVEMGKNWGRTSPGEKDAPDVLVCLSAQQISPILMGQGFNIIDAVVSLYFEPVQPGKASRVLHVDLKQSGISNLRDMEEADARLVESLLRALGVMQSSAAIKVVEESVGAMHE